MADTIKTALVCYTQATFENLLPDDDAIEGDEPQDNRHLPELAGKIAAALRVAGIEADTVKVPQRSFEPRDVAKAAFGWRLLDIKESNGRAIDLVVCLDFPAWSVNHPRKICWLSLLPNFAIRRMQGKPPVPGERGSGETLSSLLQSERRGVAEAWRVMAGSRAVAEELARTGLQVEYNPFPVRDATPESDEWQATIKRLLAGKNL